MTPVTREQFRDDGELAVLHVPTGQRYWTHPYERPEDLSEVIVSGASNEVGPQGERYDAGVIGQLAFVLLRERLSQR